jgi:ubiquitin-like modifier-activating enzyme ATG7
MFVFDWFNFTKGYFCNDVVAPVDSTKDRSMDQQCTVARPGTSAMAGALAVELLVSLLHHKDGAYANASKVTDEIGEQIGLVPHQLRGSLSSFQTMMLIGSCYSQCTACSPHVHFFEF